ncbi:MAG TPA: PKD domain-containing protein [Thermoleophilaceae bacterium]|nr:PKD domain-containing protein [Thermoleophilaceae bacterium]
MPPYPLRTRTLSRALATCALLALPLTVAPSAPAHRTPRADAAGAKVAMRIVRLARKELAKGVHEIPDGSNRAPAIHRYDLATTPHYYGAPWCAYFASYIAKRAGVPIGPGGHGLGYVPTIRAWAQASGKWTQRPRPGELITFPEHVGVVEAVYTKTHTLTSIEGNYSNGVHRVWHRWRDGMGYVRLVGGNPSNPTPEKQPSKTLPHIALKARISAYPQTTIAPGQTVDFTSLDSSGNVVKSNWDLDGNGHFDTIGSSVSRRYDNPGHYTVKLKVTDSKEHTSTTTTTITVNANRAPVAVIHVPTDATIGQNVTATADGSYDPDGHIVKYEWDLNGDGAFGQDGTSHSYTYTKPGDYSVALKVTDNDGNSATARATIHVHDYPPPASRLTCDQTDIASGTTLWCHADDSISPTHIVKHEWDMNDDGSYASGGTSSSLTYTTPGNYTVHLRVTDSHGHQGYSTLDIHVENRPPVAKIVLPSKVVQGEPVTIDGSQSSDPDGQVVAWQWDLDGDGTFERAGDTVTTTFGTWGTRTIALRVTDDWGVTSVTTAQLKVLAPPVAAGVVTTASPAVNTNTYFLPTGSSDPDGTISRYQWDFNNDGAVDKTTWSAGTSTYWKWTVAGTYQVKLTVVDDDGVKSSVLIPVTVH